MTSNDNDWMQKALELAQKPSHSVLPNPRVGAVIVKKNRLIATGYHRGPGKRHAEADALHKAEESVRGATLYCNLEPCVHTNKRTPPCVPAIVESGIKRVVIASKDPNPQVRGKGLRALRKAGIDVKTGCLRKEGDSINQAFFKNQLQGLPYIRLKLALTFDGKLADDEGRSQWITSNESRRLVHQQRKLAQSLGVGRGTLEQDRPRLSVRLQKNESFPPLVIFGGRPKKKGIPALEKRAPDQVFRVSSKATQADLRALYQNHGIGEIYIEGGAKLASSLLREGLVDELILYYGRGIVGGNGLHSLGRGWSLKSLEKSVTFQPREARLLGPDLCVRGFLNVYRPHTKSRSR